MREFAFGEVPGGRKGIDGQEAEARWYACYTRARHEKQVDRLLVERGIESFLPLVTRMSQWKDRRKQVHFALFPSYVFARCLPDELGRVVAVPGVVALVRNDGAPVTVPDEEIDNVRRFAAALATASLEPELVALPPVGERVRITSGPFRGVVGIAMEHRGRRRVVVGLRAVGQGLEVDVGAEAVEVWDGEMGG